MGTWRALLCDEVMRVGAADDLQRFFEDRLFKVENKLAVEGDKQFTPYVLRSIVFSPIRLVQKSNAVEGGSRL